MLRKARSLILSLIAVLFVVAGCGGGGGKVPSQNGPVTPVQVAKAINAINEKFLSLPSDDEHRQSTNEEMARFSRQLPEVQTADVNQSGTSIWVTFKNGRQLVLFNDREPAPVVTSTTSVQSRSTRKDLPLFSQARILTGSGNVAAVAASSNLVSILNASGNGYNADLVDASIDNLKKVSGDGIFYIESHGSLNNAKTSYALWTSTPINKSSNGIEQKYEPDLNSVPPKLVESSVKEKGPDGKEHVYEHYSITPGFVGSYMTFGQDGLVYIDACDSNSPGATIFQKATVLRGASMYAGWTGKVQVATSINASKFVIEKMLGDHKDRHALDYVNIKKLMAQQGLDTQKDKQGNVVAKFEFTPGIGNFAQLAPSIDSASFNERLNTLNVKGTFGTFSLKERDKWKLSLDGTVLPPYKVVWSDTDSVDVAVDGVEAGKHEISVSIRGHESNKYSFNLKREFVGFYRGSFNSLKSKVGYPYNGTFEFYIKSDNRLYGTARDNYGSTGSNRSDYKYILTGFVGSSPGADIVFDIQSEFPPRDENGYLINTQLRGNISKSGR